MEDAAETSKLPIDTLNNVTISGLMDFVADIK
jgi:hypothetical protein